MQIGPIRIPRWLLPLGLLIAAVLAGCTGSDGGGGSSAGSAAPTRAPIAAPPSGAPNVAKACLEAGLPPSGVSPANFAAAGYDPFTDVKFGPGAARVSVIEERNGNVTVNTPAGWAIRRVGLYGQGDLGALIKAPAADQLAQYNVPAGANSGKAFIVICAQKV